MTKLLIASLSFLVLSASAALAQEQSSSNEATPPAATGPVKLKPPGETPARHAAKQKGQPASSGAAGLGLGNHNSNAPIDITSESFDYDLNSKVGIYSGNVVVVQGDMRMRSDKMRVNVAQGKPTHIEATGKVVVVAPNGTATGDVGVYELASRTITMTGNVVLTKDKDVMRGTKLVMDMNTNLAHLYAQGMPGNRVRGLFIPKQDQGGSGQAHKPAQKSAGAAGAGTKSAGAPGK